LSNTITIGKPTTQALQGDLLLIINGKTTANAVNEALSMAKNSELPITVVFTSRPPLVSENCTPWEADQEFAFYLEKGRETLSVVESMAKKMGINVRTEFNWANSSSEILEHRKFGTLLDKTA
jgi:AAA+ superfamily predicted ATPase